MDKNAHNEVNSGQNYQVNSDFTWVVDFKKCFYIVGTLSKNSELVTVVIS